MVNDEVVLKKKKKLKKKLSELGDVEDSTPVKKKKVKQGGDDTVRKKKKKKKKLLKNSTMLQERTPGPELAVPEEKSDEELFGSQSPIVSSGASVLSPPPLSKHAPLHRSNGTDRESDDDEEATTPVKKSPQRPSPVMVFKKEDKALDAEEEQFVEPDSDSNGSDDEIADLPASGEMKSIPAAPLSDPIISQHEQDRRDLVLLEQVNQKFPENKIEDINWNEVYCFNMSTDQMSSRFEVLLSNIPREKNVKTLVSEAKIAYCNAKVREVPMTKRDPLARIGLREGVKKRVNAFTLFSAQFDPRLTQKQEIKAKWDVFDQADKKKLMKEARALNNIHRIQSGEPKVRRPLSGYQLYSKEQMNNGLKMVDIGVRWKALMQEERDEYKAKATEKANNEKTSSNEPLSQE